MEQDRPEKRERVIRVNVVPFKTPDPSLPLSEGPMRFPWDQVKHWYEKRQLRPWYRPKAPESEAEDGGCARAE